MTHTKVARRMFGDQQNPLKQRAFGDIFEDYRVLTEKDKVRQNTSDDYGLGDGWYFCTLIWRQKGKHSCQGYHDCVYVKTAAEFL